MFQKATILGVKTFWSKKRVQYNTLTYRRHSTGWLDTKRYPCPGPLSWSCLGEGTPYPGPIQWRGNTSVLGPDWGTSSPPLRKDLGPETRGYPHLPSRLPQETTCPPVDGQTPVKTLLFRILWNALGKKPAIGDLELITSYNLIGRHKEYGVFLEPW